jgi:non-homologous end joining protein Ku
MATSKSTVPYTAYKSSLRVEWSSDENPLMTINFDVALHPPKDNSDAVKYDSVCPGCHAADKDADATKLTTQYHCPVNDKHGPYLSADVLKATKVGKALRIVATVEEVAEVRAVDEEDPTKENLVLTAYDALQVEATTYPIGTAYVMTPNVKTKAFPIFLATVGHDGRINAGDGLPITLIGEVTLRNNRKLMQVRRWGDQLVLQELARPDELKTEFGTYVEDIPDKAVLGLATMLTAESRPFVGAEFQNEQRAKLRAFTDARLESPDAQVINLPQRETVAKATTDDALLAMLEASVVDAKKPAPAKRASRAKKAS